MFGSNKYLAQALQWAAEESEEYDTELCVDLPDMGWITIHSIEETGGDVTCSYTSGFMSRRAPSTAIFPVEKIKAIRRQQNTLSVVRHLKDR